MHRFFALCDLWAEARLENREQTTKKPDIAYFGSEPAGQNPRWRGVFCAFHRHLPQMGIEASQMRTKYKM